LDYFGVIFGLIRFSEKPKEQIFSSRRQNMVEAAGRRINEEFYSNRANWQGLFGGK
jgi:hypothetical protein